jgi:hypothetical protein
LTGVGVLRGFGVRLGFRAWRPRPSPD